VHEEKMETNKAFFGLLAVTLVPACAAAQVPSIHESGAFDSGKRAGTLSGSPVIVWTDTIENRGSSSLVAFHATYDCPQSKTLYDYDYLFRYGLDLSIPPGDSVEIIAADPDQCPGGVDAAIFSDGHTEGDAQEVSPIYARRRGTYKALGESIKLLSAIAAQEKTPQQVIDIFASECHRIARDQTSDGDERTAMIALYSVLKVALRDPVATLRAPSDKTARQPSLAEVVKANNFSREQAQATMIIKKLNEWRADLEDNLYPK
jgi:hypothetical protein